MTNNPPSARILPGEYGFPLTLKARYDNFIGGDWVPPADGDYYQNLTPVTGQPLCEIASSGKRDIDLALDAAHKIKDKWAHTSVQDRAAILFKMERAIRRVESIRSGNPLDSITQMGAQVSHGQLETILNYIDIGKKEGPSS